MKKDKNLNYTKVNEWYKIPSKFFLFRMILKTITYIENSPIFYDRNTTKFADMVNTTKENLNKLYPNAKFIFLFYDKDDDRNWTSKLDKDILIMTTSDYTDIKLITDEKYRHGSDPHPTELVWKETTPDLVKKLKEIGYLN